MATAPTPNDLTRQQLDELDALLQRMLSVPLAPGDTPMPVAPPQPAPPTPPSWRIDPPAPAASVSPPHLLFAEPYTPPAPTLEVPPAMPPVPEPTPPPPAVKPLPLPVPAQVRPAEPVLPPFAPEPVPASRITPVPPPPPAPFFLLPFVALNVLFDSVCGLFGPPGRLLRSGFFKTLYGLAGLGLLAYSAVHVAQQQGWITLPITLPWPR